MGASSLENMDVNCVICLEHFREGEELLVMNCGHVFHEYCILTWLEEENACPVCRNYVSESDLEFIVETISHSNIRLGKTSYV